jgi:hypothetical protein
MIGGNHQVLYHSPFSRYFGAIPCCFEPGRHKAESTDNKQPKRLQWLGLRGWHYVLLLLRRRMLDM